MRFSIFFLISLLIASNYFFNVEGKEPMVQFVNLQIEAKEAVAEVKPTQSYDFYFKYYNGGYFQRNLYLFIVEFKVDVDGEGWEAYVSPTLDFMFPNETRIGRVRVVASARPSNYANITLQGRLRDIYGTWHYRNFTFKVKSAPYHSFDIKVDNIFIKAKQEEIYRVPIKIINYGNYEERFLINPFYVPPGWKVSFSQSPVIIPPNGEYTIDLFFVTPHEKFFIQERTFTIMVEISAMEATPKIVSIIVSMDGFHLTLGQTVAVISSMPSLLLLIFVGIIIYRKNVPYTYLPKPWKEERKELDKLKPIERKKLLKEMKEEWKSAKYFCKDWYRYEKEIERLRRLRNKKQRHLEEKIMKEWRDSWIEAYKVWKEECNKIREEYERGKRKLKEIYEKAKKYGIDLPPLPKISYPPEPKKPAKPKVPEYKLNEEKGILIEPDEIVIERILLPLKKNKMLAKRDIIKIKEMSKEIIEKMKASFNAIERKFEEEEKKRKWKIKR